MVANVIVGLIVAVATQIVAFPLLVLHASVGQNVRLALVFRSFRSAAAFSRVGCLRPYEGRFSRAAQPKVCTVSREVSACRSHGTPEQTHLRRRASGGEETVALERRL